MFLVFKSDDSRGVEKMLNELLCESAFKMHFIRIDNVKRDKFSSMISWSFLMKKYEWRSKFINNERFL